MLSTRSRASRAGLVGAVVAVILASVTLDPVATAVARPAGVGPPAPGTGIGTSAALSNPQCHKDQGAYGRLDFVLQGFGPVCVVQWKQGANNGGATSPGVTKNAVEVVAIVPNAQQVAATPRQGQPMNYTTGQPGTVQDAMSDALAAYAHSFVPAYTYGRDIDMEFVVSSGDDEAAQRADAVTVKAKKPFVVVDTTASSLPVFDTEIAAAKIPVFSLNATVDETLKQAPYRWGQTDPVAGTMNGAEFIGKQLAGKKAAYAGDDAMHSQTRKFGLVRSDVFDLGRFTQTLAKYGARIAPGAALTYPGTTSTLGDPTVAQEQAPILVTKLKSAGITSVVLLADSAMVTALTKQATANDYHPEWIYTGTQNIDLPLLARAYDQDQWAHSLGISNVPPGSPTAATSVPNAIQWYWGPGKGTFGINYTNTVGWLVSSIMYAGPKLTPQTLKQGWFSIPAAGGSADPDPALRPRGVRSGYGRTNGLPYEEYMRGNKDFTISWWDSETTGPPILGFPGGKGTLWYTDGAHRYYAGHYPTKPVTLFDKSKAIYQFDAPTSPPPVVTCSGCPSETGQGTPSSTAS
jgi:hypothetical protein